MHDDIKQDVCNEDNPYHIGSISVPEQNIFLETWADFCEVSNITDLICSFSLQNWLHLMIQIWNMGQRPKTWNSTNPLMKIHVHD